MTSLQPQFSLPAAPAAWLTFCTSRELRRAPLSRTLLGRKLVAFRTESGRVAVMHSRCSHMGSDLGQGKVVGESIQCPFHHWQFGVDGACSHIPAEPNNVPSACQMAFTAAEQHGLIFMFNGGEPDFDLPFFSGATPQQLHRAKPFKLVLECPWYMVGANGVDVQHFQTTHDRELLGSPEVEYPQPFVHRTKTKFAVIGRGPADALTRTFAGSEVTMDVTDWAGSLFFVQATFQRTCSFGMVGLMPLQPTRTLVFGTVFVRRSDGGLGRRLFDPANAAIRRLFIHNFLKPDVARSAGTDYHPGSLIAADGLMADYFQWLSKIHGSDVDQSPSAAPAEVIS